MSTARRSTRELRTAIFEEAASLVRAEYARAVTAQEVASRVATSPRQLRRAFEEVGGTTYRSFLREVRMRRAAELLTSTELPIGEVAGRVGYHGASQFTKAFRRVHGRTPSELRAS